MAAHFLPTRDGLRALRLAMAEIVVTHQRERAGGLQNRLAFSRQLPQPHKSRFRLEIIAISPRAGYR